MKIATFGMRRPFHPVLMIPVLRHPAMKYLLAAFLLLCAIGVRAQTTTLIKTPAQLSDNDDPSKGTSTSTGTTLFCTDQSAFRLTSSLTDPTATGTPVPYTSWKWEEIDENGTPGPLPATAVPDKEKLNVASATAGWHTYQVTAATGVSECPADPVIFTVYVLPNLTIKADVDPANNPDLTYCAANGAPTGPKAINLKSTVTFTTPPRKIAGLKDYAVSDFELKYVWSKEEVGVPASKTDVGTGADYTIVEPAVTTAGVEKKYNYSVKVVYTVKSCGDYTAIAQSGGQNAVITVTPKPGKPVITIQ